MNQKEEEYAFNHEIGHALQNWAGVEAALEYLVAACSTTKGGGTDLCIGYRSIENLRAKLSYLNALFEHKYCTRPEFLKQWGKLHERINSLKTLRNRIAHGRPVITSPMPSGGRVRLKEPAFFDKSVGQKTDLESYFKHGLGIVDIAEHANRFTALAVCLHNFVCVLNAREKRFPESLEQPPRPPTIRSIEARMREASGRRQRPSSKSRR